MKKISYIVNKGKNKFNYWNTMIKYLSYNITDFFSSNNIIEEEDKEIYVYGLQLIISTLIGITLILVLGLILNKLFYSIYQPKEPNCLSSGK
nr:accessory gene regulator B family protein [Sedimentibacter sp.]